MADETTAEQRSGHIEDVGMLDLRWAKSAEDLSGIRSIEDVGVVLVPEHLAGSLTGIAMEDVGLVVPVPTGENVHLLTGQVKLTAETLAGGSPEVTLVLVGQIQITGAVTMIGYKELRVYGQLFATRGSEGVIGAKITQFSGQALYLPASARTLTGDITIGQAYLELLPEPCALVVMGNLTLETDITPEVLKAKVPEIVLMGAIHAPKPLLPLVQVLTVENMGEIRERQP